MCQKPLTYATYIPFRSMERKLIMKRGDMPPIIKKEQIKITINCQLKTINLVSSADFISDASVGRREGGGEIYILKQQKKYLLIFAILA